MNNWFSVVDVAANGGEYNQMIKTEGVLMQVSLTVLNKIYPKLNCSFSDLSGRAQKVPLNVFTFWMLKFWTIWWCVDHVYFSLCIVIQNSMAFRGIITVGVAIFFPYKYIGDLLYWRNCNSDFYKMKTSFIKTNLKLVVVYFRLWP